MLCDVTLFTDSAQFHSQQHFVHQMIQLLFRYVTEHHLCESQRLTQPKVRYSVC